jgi:hypothetical protein
MYNNLETDCHHVREMYSTPLLPWESDSLIQEALKQVQKSFMYSQRRVANQSFWHNLHNTSYEFCIQKLTINGNLGTFHDLIKNERIKYSPVTLWAAFDSQIF